MSVWTDLGFRESLYQVEPVPANAEGERLLVGRDEELRALGRWLTSSGTHPTIEGQNGVGKSSLAAVAGFQAQREFVEGRTGQLLIPLPSPFQLDSGSNAEAFIRSVFFAVAQAFIDNYDLIARDGRDVPEVGQIKDWLNAPTFMHRSGGAQVAGFGGSYGQGKVANEASGFSEAGFRTAVGSWLRTAFPSLQAGGFVCVLDNLELLQTVTGARKMLEALRDPLFRQAGLRWVLCGAKGIMRGAASSARLHGHLGEPMELRPIPDEAVEQVVARRIEVFKIADAAYVPVGPVGFRHLFEVGNRNLRNALKYAEDFTFWLLDQGALPDDETERLELLEAWMAVTAERYQADIAGVGDRGWEVFDEIVERGGSVSPSDYEDLGFESSQAFRGQVRGLEENQLVESSVDESDKRRRLIEVTSKGWIVNYERSD